MEAVGGDSWGFCYTDRIVRRRRLEYEQKKKVFKILSTILRQATLGFKFQDLAFTSTRQASADTEVLDVYLMYCL